MEAKLIPNADPSRINRSSDELEALYGLPN